MAAKSSLLYKLIHLAKKASSLLVWGTVAPVLDQAAADAFAEKKSVIPRGYHDLSTGGMIPIIWGKMMKPKV